MSKLALLTSRKRDHSERWLGRPCHVTSFFFERDEFGKRIEVRVWLDTDTMDLDAVMGYGSHIHRFERKVDIPCVSALRLEGVVVAMADKVFGD